MNQDDHLSSFLSFGNIGNKLEIGIKSLMQVNMSWVFCDVIDRRMMKDGHVANVKQFRPKTRFTLWGPPTFDIVQIMWTLPNDLNNLYARFIAKNPNINEQSTRKNYMEHIKKRLR